jgi:hypothetical protein
MRPKLALQAADFPELALLWVPEAYSLDQQGLMGRQSAGAGFIRAIAAAAPPRMYCYAQTRAEAEAFKRTIESNGGCDTVINWVPLTRPKGLHHAGLLYRPDATSPPTHGGARRTAATVPTRSPASRTRRQRTPSWKASPPC